MPGVWRSDEADRGDHRSGAPGGRATTSARRQIWEHRADYRWMQHQHLRAQFVLGERRVCGVSRVRFSRDPLILPIGTACPTSSSRAWCSPGWGREFDSQCLHCRPAGKPAFLLSSRTTRVSAQVLRTALRRLGARQFPISRRKKQYRSPSPRPRPTRRISPCPVQDRSC